MSFAARTLSAAAVGGASANAGTLSAGLISDGSGYGYYTGYGPTYGSSSAGYFTDGKQFYSAYDYAIPAVGYESANVIVAGFGSDPGKTGYMTSFTIGGVTKTASAATVYYYDSLTGQASWAWGSSASPQAWGMVYGNTYSWAKS